MVHGDGADAKTGAPTGGGGQAGEGSSAALLGGGHERIQGPAGWFHRLHGALQPGGIHVEKLAAFAHHRIEEHERRRDGGGQAPAAPQLTPDGGQTDGGKNDQKDLGAAQNAVQGEIRRDAEQPQLTPDGGQTDGGKNDQKDLGAAQNAVQGEIRRDAEQPQLTPDGGQTDGGKND